MAYKKTTTNSAVYIVHLHNLNVPQQHRCHALRKEAGRLWTDRVHTHVASRDSKWLSCRDLEIQFKKGYDLHSQSIQAMAQKLSANIETAIELKKANPDAKLPYREKPFQTVTWKKQGLRFREGILTLSNGVGRPCLVVPVPERYHECQIQQVELTWDVDHYCLCLNVNTGLMDAPILAVVFGCIEILTEEPISVPVLVMES